MRSVLDIGIFVSAIVSPHYACRRVLRMVFDGSLQLVAGHDLYGAYKAALDDSDVFGDEAFLLLEERMILLDSLMEMSDWIDLNDTGRPSLLGSGNRYVLEIAVAGQAQYIVTHKGEDFQFLEGHSAMLSVVHPDDFLMLSDGVMGGDASAGTGIDEGARSVEDHEMKMLRGLAILDKLDVYHGSGDALTARDDGGHTLHDGGVSVEAGFKRPAIMKPAGQGKEADGR